MEQGGGGGGGVPGSPGELPRQTPRQLPPAQQARIDSWRATPPQQQPQGLPTAVTTLTPELLTNTGEVALRRQLITEVGVGNFNWGTWGTEVIAIFTILPFTLNFTSHLAFTGVQTEGQ